MTLLRCAVLAWCAGLVLAPASRAADDELSFKKRGSDEKAFATRVGEAIVKAAHGSAKKVSLLKYNREEPKANRTNLVLKLEYHGLVSDKRYVADIVVKIDSSDKDAWEVLNIEYADTNTAFKANDKKIQELVKHFNK